MVLDRPAATFLASLSTSSFPFTLLYPDIHLMFRLVSSELAAVMRLLIKYCPVVVRFDVKAAFWIACQCIMTLFLPTVSGVLYCPGGEDRSYDFGFVGVVFVWCSDICLKRLYSARNSFLVQYSR